MRKQIFFMKLLALLMILLMLFYYQQIAAARAVIRTENEAAVREAEAYNAEVKAAILAQEEDVQTSAFLDGVYEGSGSGFGGEIIVSVTIEKGRITEIVPVAHSGEDDAYFSQAMALIDTVLETQSLQVDTVSGATFSSRGLLEAVDQALGKAGF